ncbi:MAG: M48 family metalloprotease [Planctomycetaceae bacterium]|nr:M48 family metalloprotease [Planctomycetaceae bacterium]
MSSWFYYNNGQKLGPVSGGQLKGLAKTGLITPETIIETEEGKTAPARKIKGLTFAETAQPKAVPVPPPMPIAPVKKTPNPLVSSEGMAKICQTLASAEEYEKYRKLILTPLQNPLPVIETSVGYKLGLVFVAFFLILLPLFYFAAIIGLIVAEYYYCFTLLPDWLEQTEDKAAGMMFYLVPPVAMGMLILILIKPLFYFWRGRDTDYEISREREPLLFELVDHICDFVGAPPPNKIVVDCRVNASARLSHGFWGALFGGNDSDLIIGMPLVAGMTTSEFAGVLAHEFGHFTQSGSRRMTYIIGTVLNWFAHVYYYRDRMDLWLYNGSKVGIPYTIVFCYVIRGILWLGRRVIWCLMMLGNLAAGFMSRQMEFDADYFEIQLGGSERFTVSSRKMIMLSIANDKTVSDLNYMLKEERLADNYPILIAVNSRILDNELQRLATKIIKEEKTGLFSTHPSTRDRIEAAQGQNVPGVMHVDLPASLLFRNFLGLSREVSLHFYREVVGLQFDPHILKNVAPVIEQFQREDLCMKAITNFFQSDQTSGLLLPLSDIDISTQQLSETRTLFLAARNRQAIAAADAHLAEQEFEKVSTNLSIAVFFRELVRIGVKPDFSGVDFRFRTLAEGNRMVDKFTVNIAAIRSRLSNRNTAAAERLVIALQLLKHTEIQNRIEGGPELLRRMETLLPIIKTIGNLRNETIEVSQRLYFVSSGLGMLQGMKEDKAQALWNSILSEGDLFRRFLRQFRNMFGSVPYPFDHGKGITLGEFLVPTFNEVATEPLEHFYGVVQLMGYLHTTYRFALGESAAVALAVEDALNLPRLPVPPPNKEQ